MLGTRAVRGVERITLRRPPLNILDIPTSRKLLREIREASRDPGVRVVVLSGAGKCFSAGVDIRDHTPARVKAMLSAFHAAVRALYHCPKPTVAEVHGHCLGGGWELAMVCDFVAAAKDARFALPEIGLACYPPVAAALLPGRVGGQRAAELVMGGRALSAREAMAWGLVNRVGDAEGIVKDLLGKSGSALACAKAAMRVSDGFEAALKASERIYLRRLAKTKDMAEGVEAFLEKRKARWRHA